MTRVSAFIDGFNLYHALDENKPFHQFKWLNLRRLIELFLRARDTLADVFYFTTLASWDLSKVQRHSLYIKVLESLNVKLVHGKFRKEHERCKICNNRYNVYREKETDVNIAVQVLEQAKSDSYDRAIILTGDSDQVPLIKTFKRMYKDKEIGVITPPNRHNKALIAEAKFHHKIDRMHLLSARFPDNMTLADGTAVQCPQEWM